MKEVEKNFFAEMDQKRQSVAPAWAILFIVLILIFVVSVYGLVKIRSAYRNLSFSGWNLNQSVPKISLSNQISELSKQSQVNFSLTMDSNQLSVYLNLSDDSFPLKNTYAKIKPGLVVIYGRLRTSRLGLPASITLHPEVQDDSIVFVSQPTEMENVYMNKETQDKIASEFTARVSFDLNLSGKTKLDTVEASDNLLTFQIAPK